METRKRFCKSAEEFDPEELLAAIRPLDGYEKELFKVIYDSGTKALEAVRWIFLKRDNSSDAFSDIEIECEYFWETVVIDDSTDRDSWTRFEAELLSKYEDLHLTCDDVWDAVYRCESTKFEVLRAVSEASYHIFEKVCDGLSSLGFIRRDLKFNVYLDRFLNHDLGGFQGDMPELVLSNGRYESYDINLESTRLSMVMNYIESILPPMQFEIYKFNLMQEESFQRDIDVANMLERYRAGHISYDWAGKARGGCGPLLPFYSEVECKLLLNAMFNVAKHGDEAIKIIFSL